MPIEGSIKLVGKVHHAIEKELIDLITRRGRVVIVDADRQRGIGDRLLEGLVVEGPTRAEVAVLDRIDANALIERCRLAVNRSADVKDGREIAIAKAGRGISKRDADFTEGWICRAQRQARAN